MGDGPEGDLRESTTLLGKPPDVDRIAMARARARAERALFGTSQPARIGRYEIIDRIGDGGMGRVYSARDPQLQRKVALKVLHPARNHDAQAQQRMILEARALAKLDHPGVVKVHDVLVEDGQVVVVMALLDGQTLDDWQDRAPHTWREIVEVYAQAGDGLAAAHGVDVVHRDFKPSNAILGTDGRVRVVDFGLARLATADDEPRSDAPAPARPELTATGDVLGTLAFSAPEQLAGGTATAASDQFSFCVALHTALEGVSPFTGADPDARRASILRGTILRAADGRRIPPWLHAVIARGLSVDPDDRFPSMREVVRELRRPRGLRRWRSPALVAAALGVAIAGTAVLARGPEDPTTCDGGAALVEQTWNGAVRDQIRDAIQAVGSPYAIEVRERVLGTLDRVAASWRDVHRGVCRAHLRGETSDALLDRQMTCLAHRLGALRAATQVLAELDATSLPNAMDVAAAIPGPSACADLELLQGELEPPNTPALRFQVDGLRAQISEAEARARAGRTVDALAKLRSIRAVADRTPYPPVQVEAALAEGRIRLSRYEREAALAALSFARQRALEQQMLPAAVEAEARIIYLEGQRSPRLDRLERELEVVLPLSAGLRGDHFVRPLLLNNVGTVYLAAGRRADAARYFAQARAEVDRHDPRSLELAVVDRNLAMLTRDPVERAALARASWARLRDELGEGHLSTLDGLALYAAYVLDPAVAFDALTRAARGYERLHPQARWQIAVVAARRAFLAAELGDPARAIPLYEAAIAKMADATNDHLVRLRRLCAGELALLRADPQRAILELGPVYEASIHSARWWERGDALRAEVGLAQAAAALGDAPRAIAYLEEAVRRYPEVLAVSEETEPRQLLARARRALGRLLRQAGPAEVSRAKDLEREAEAFWRAASPRSYRWRLAP